MKTIITTIFLSLITIVSHSQNWNWAVGENIGGEGLAVCHDNSGSVYLSGVLSSTGTIGTQTISATGSKGVIIKYNSAGTVQWFRTAIGQSACGYGVECDNSGNVFLAGCFSNTVNLGTTTLTGATSINPMLIKYDTNGNLLWALTSQSTTPGANSVAYSVSTDALGNSVIVGSFSGSVITLGSQTAVKPTTASVTYFVAKVDPNGNVLWIKNGDAAYSVASYVDVDLNNNIYVTGNFTGTLVSTTNTVTSKGSYDYFVAKYDPAGNLQWLTGNGGSLYETSNCVYADASGDVYVGGSYNSSDMVVNSTTLVNVGVRDAFLIKYSGNGIPQWVQTVGGPGNENGYTIGHFNGSIYFAGGMLSQSMTVGTYTLYSNNPSDGVFIVQFDPNGLLVSATSLDGGGDDQLAITVSGCNLYLGGDLWNNSSKPVAFGTHTVIPVSGESLFLANMETTAFQVITITGGGSVCAGSSLTLTASGAGSYTWVGSSAGNSIVVTPTANANYTVLSQSTLACMPTATTTQSVAVLASPTLSAKNYTFCSGDKRTISVSGADTYTWYNGTKTSSVIVQPTVTTTYSVTGTSTLTGCSSTIGISLTKSPCTGIENVNNSKMASISPNPASIAFYIKSDQVNLFYELQDVFGKTIITGQVNEKTTMVNCDGIPPGLYFVRVMQHDNVVQIEKLLIN